MLRLKGGFTIPVLAPGSGSVSIIPIHDVIQKLKIVVSCFIKKISISPHRIINLISNLV